MDKLNHIIKFFCKSILLFFVFIIPVFTSASEATQSEEWRWNNVERVVVIPDIHGAFPAFVRLLQSTNVVDSSLNWIGGIRIWSV